MSMQPSILYFDLGDTLFFRTTPHIELDARLIASITNRPSDEVRVVLEQHKYTHPGVYDFSKDTNSRTTLEEEDAYDAAFFQEVFTQLGVMDRYAEFTQRRKDEARYTLFPDVVTYLEKLSSRYTLGVISNGAPSRLRVLEQLRIRSYFDDAEVYVSNMLGMHKPDPAIFALIQSKHPSAQCVLIDDELVNIDTAKSLGWETILIPRPHSLKALERLLV